ncbi:ornithine carbamoyltransferase [Streptomyces sp. SID10815]|uniref:ornithine carbamoyltransferase n=1 Tax=Streptomyces sp. SID10815 TaxID=2706027 RepID=UPI0013C73AE4|nr:ornithine carbamoyltransferase [Streptomyces sp. SID10815]NEA48096.1 ornithine carbamoyltransferase [Streptomyces sp. SID10815]NEA48181.1 ornithine carbamoyltransferase [Streptomyces sp. SID10815]
MRHLISLTDLTDDELYALVARGAEFAAGAVAEPLRDAIVGVYFRRTSTRTRTAFTSGALRLGARTITFGPDDLQLNTGETTEDTGRVLSGMLDLLVARTADATAELRSWAAAGPMSVVNAMSAEEHPTQGLTDLTTLHCHFGRIEGLRVLYVGEGNNSAAALALALTRYPDTELELRTPPGYGLAPDILATAAEQAARSGAKLSEQHDMAALPAGFDAVYTTRWQTTGTSKPTADWRTVFAPFQVTGALWESSPKAVFLHDLPAHRGEEVTAEVLDGPASLAFTQATHKLHSAMAVLEWCRAAGRP